MNEFLAVPVPMPETEAEHATEPTRYCLKRLRKAVPRRRSGTGTGTNDLSFPRQFLKYVPLAFLRSVLVSLRRLPILEVYTGASLVAVGGVVDDDVDDDDDDGVMPAAAPPPSDSSSLAILRRIRRLSTRP